MAESTSPLKVTQEEPLNKSQSASLWGRTGGARERSKADADATTQESEDSVLCPGDVSTSALLDNDVRSPPSNSDVFVLSSPSASKGGASATLRETNTREYILSADDSLIKDILSRNVGRQDEAQDHKEKVPFRDLIFTRQFTAFDRQNPASASSPFHGFFTMFWLGIFLFLVKLAADNWRAYGNILGPSELLQLMFDREVFVMGVTDIVLCSSTVFCLVLQKAVLTGYLSWNNSGWIIQNVCSHSDIISYTFSIVNLTLVAVAATASLIMIPNLHDYSRALSLAYTELRAAVYADCLDNG